MTVPGVAHHEMALNFLKPLFLNPKLRIEDLTMSCDSEVNYLIESLTEIMKNSTKSPFHVENLTITLRKPMELTSITALFIPGVLETIDIQGHEEFRPRLKDFVETPHFKQAKTLMTEYCMPLHTVMVEKFLHLTTFEIAILYVTIEDLRWLRKVISETPTLQQCKLRMLFYITIPLIEDAFPEAVVDHRTDASYYSYPIPDSPFFLEFKFYDIMIAVERKMQE
ncbi:hypothetical protein CAEBREN_16776 [Caenorhabditis brenneri]|uniref:DUF38 domain-containing protein n=1 Tax=Caenorhabditis brenneri TaxID=135651 RepID=G0MW09_CAEBE|nr:hypothetical protein CAEBREN_16776 [Caenorhabditis brenneri]